MRYRAILVTNEKLPRPIQSFFNHLEEAKKWSRTILTGRPQNDWVQIWETDERLNCNVWPESTESPGRLPDIAT